MTQYLPPNLLALFAPRDPVPYLPPLDKLPHEKKLPPYNGVAQCLQDFEDPKDTPPPTRVETKDERKERKRKERAEQVAYKLEQDLALWDPTNDANGTTDAYKTLFVGRINYDTSESKLRREFESYGPVRKIRLVHNIRTGKPRGFAFVEYEHERDMHSAYKHADGKKIDGRRVLVDVERSRTVKGWRPRRLGGGLGGTRKGGPDVNTKYSGREESAVSRDDRSESRERERGGRRRRSRSRSRERPERAERRGRGGRSRSREPRRRRSRSRDRKRSKERSSRPEEEEDGKKRRRSRSRERERKRSRSRDRKRSRRSRSPRDRKRDRSRDRREREKEEARAAGEAAGVNPDSLDNGAYTEMKAENGFDPTTIVVKEEKHKPEYDKYAKNAADADDGEVEEQAPPPAKDAPAKDAPAAPETTETPEGADEQQAPSPDQTNEYGSVDEQTVE